MANIYCVKCRTKKDVADSQVQHVTMKNGKKAIKASCPTCGTTMFKIGG